MNSTDNTDVIRAEFTSAVEVARHALAEFNKEPLVPSKRGELPAPSAGCEGQAGS